MKKILLTIFIVVLIIVTTISVTLLVINNDVAEAPSTAQDASAGQQQYVPSSTISEQDTSDYSNKGLTSFPDAALADTGIKELNISQNNIDGALPSQIQKLTNLEVLNASDNLMTGVPAEIGQLTKLRIIDFSNNKLTGLPQELGNLQNLEVLDLRGNDVSEFDLGIISGRLPASTQILK